jgi:hypothetical protein
MDTRGAGGEVRAVVRSGDEPVHARSPLGLRLALTLSGAALWAGSAALMFGAGMPGPGAGFLVVAALCLVNAVLVVRRLRQGPHWQPGPRVPAYRPVPDGDRPEPARAPRPPVDERTRATRYLRIMGACIGLLVVAWGVVLPWSVPLAVALSLVAMVLPPIAAVVANRGWDRH